MEIGFKYFLHSQVEVPFEFHRFIIGRGGENVRQLMNKHDVNIKVPSSDQQSSTIVVTGPKAKVETAKDGKLYYPRNYKSGEKKRSTA